MAPHARGWFLGQVARIAEQNPAEAKQSLERMRTAQRLLTAFPSSSRPGLFLEKNALVVEGYVFTVRYRSDVIEIANIRHSRRSSAFNCVDLSDRSMPTRTCTE